MRGGYFCIIPVFVVIMMGLVVNVFSSTNINSNNKAAVDQLGLNAQVTALFVFGDSLVDNGNNNFLNSMAKSNYYPYGIDSNLGSTGRFSNGNTFVDYLGSTLYLINYISICF